MKQKMNDLISVAVNVLRRMIRQLLCRGAVRVIMNMANDRALAELRITPAHPAHNTYQEGWEAFAKLLRGRLKEEGYLRG